jgi:glutaminyl-peptide cyclotransferase
MRIRFVAILNLCVIVLTGCATVQMPSTTPVPKIFDGSHAYQNYLLAQMNIGVRPAGSAADRATGDYILAQLKEPRWKTETQVFNYRNVPVRNVIAKAAEGRGPVIIIGAHYDTRPRADQDKTNPTLPILGANDGASGVAVLLELARALDTAKLKNEVWLAFFDAEDNGDLSTCDLIPAPNCDKTPWTWSIGATYVAEHLSSQPAAVIVIDMIGDADQNIYYEHNSDKELQQQIWGIAAKLGYTRQFVPEYKWSMSDDHTPFLQRGIRAVDMIDFDYPYWHTTQDTADKVSAESLERVGRVLQTWLENQ